MTKKVKIGGTYIGGGTSVKVQSMTTFKPSDIQNTVRQINSLERAGCEIVRFSVQSEADADAVKLIKKRVSLPLVADIHFNHRLALRCIENGIDKIRINPGNIGGESNLKELAAALNGSGVPVRVGANSGSIKKEYLLKYGVSRESLVESALDNVRLLEKYGVDNIVISVKASSVPLTVAAYRLISQKCDYPLHLGVTEAGTLESGLIKSAAGIGSLLLDGIGDTIRVSLTDSPVREAAAAKGILRAVGLDKNYVQVIACPTCGRCEWNVQKTAKKVEKMVKNCKKPLKIAVMGCIVNGPGEAKECDLGIAGGEGKCAIFKKGKVYKTLDAAAAEAEFEKEVKRLTDE